MRGIGGAAGGTVSLGPLYALAIALLVVAFVGFGISAFYEEPRLPLYPSAVDQRRDERTPEERKKVEEYWEKQRAYEEASSNYNLVVTCICVGAAVLLLVAALLRLNRMPVIGEGATLGAVFTLFYGLVRAFMTNDEQIRFGAVAVGLVILLFLVYWKFARSETGAPSGTAGS